MAVRDPLTNQVFPKVGDFWEIPSSRIDPISQKVLAFWPEPNSSESLARNFKFLPASAPTDRHHGVVRGDYNIDPNNNMFLRFIRNNEFGATTPRFPNGTGAVDSGIKAWTLGGHYNRVFSSSLVNDSGFNYMHYDVASTAVLAHGTNFHRQAGITNVTANVDPAFTGMPVVNIAGFLGPGDGGPSFRSTGIYEFIDNVSWQHGRHGIRFGGSIRFIDQSFTNTATNSTHTFNNRYSGDNFGDFLLGLPSQVLKTASALETPSRVPSFGIYFHDDWKVTAKLTVNFGLRYDYEAPFSTPNNDGVLFDMRTGEMVLSEHIGNRRAIESFYTQVRPDIKLRFIPQKAPYDGDRNNFAPRLGIAYQLPRNSVIRFAGGFYYDAPQTASLAADNNYAPNVLRPTWTADPARPVFRLPDGSEIAAGWNPEGAGGPEATVRYPIPLTIFPFYSRDFPYGLNLQWMASIQHELTTSFLLEAQYLGSRAQHLLGYHQTNYTVPGPGGVQNRLPYPSFARIQGHHMGLDSYYHGLGLKAEQRFRSGLSFLASYTWSKAIDTGSTLNQGPQWTNPLNLWGSSRGPADFDVRHRFVFSYQYELPIGQGRVLGGNWPRLVDTLLGGWGVRGITVFQSGFQYTPTMSLARSNYCAQACIAVPDRIGNGNLAGAQRSIDRYWDGSAFLLPALTAPRAGNTGRGILRGPGINNWDIGVYKKFRLTEAASLELRYETFNTWNHTQFAAPPVSVENPTTFGRIVNALPPRISQFVVRLTF